MTAYIVLAATDGEEERELRRFRDFHSAEGYILGHPERRHEVDYTRHVYTLDGDPVVYRIVRDENAERPEPTSEEYYIIQSYTVHDRHGHVVFSQPLESAAYRVLGGLVREQEREEVAF